tara:strand:- start:1371 stop:1799 length:429 start_codon:yes stop_codon:yes gene_type:complete
MKKFKELFKKKELIIYTSDNCQYCKTTKELLDEEKIQYKEKDIRKHEDEWNDLVVLTNMPVTPAISFGDDYLFPSRDFPNPQILVKILKNHKKSNFNDNKHVLEKIKTLNYHINMAFNKLDQRLTQIENELKPEKDEHKSTS